MTGTAFPSGVKLVRFSLTLDQNRASSESLFTRRRQVTSLSGGTADRWVGLFETIPLNATTAKSMTSFFATVGLYGVFNMPNPWYSGPTAGTTTALVQGAGQSGTSLIVDGLPATTTVAVAGDYFQVGDEFKILKSNATTSGGGVVTLSFEPALRVSPADNATVTFTGARITARLTTIPEFSQDQNRLFTFSASFEEYLP